MVSRKDLMILDGGMSRELMRIEAPFRQPEWSALALMQAPDAVQQIHTEFVTAGADVVTTNSYALVPFHIGEERFRSQAKDLAGLAGQLARNVADKEFARTGRRILVAGSLPPVFGSYRPDLFDGTRVREYLDVLVQGLTPYVDFWLGETLSLIAEAETVREAVQSSGRPLWIAFTLDDHGSKETAHLRSGETVADATHWTLQSGAEGLLFNCSRPEFMLAAVKEAQTVFSNQDKSLPLGVYANAFVPNPKSYAANADVSATRDELDLQMYTSFVREWVDAGVTLVGGCCGIGVEHIKRLSLEFGRGASRGC